jgi:hypothetical protein
VDAAGGQSPRDLRREQLIGAAHVEAEILAVRLIEGRHCRHQRIGDDDDLDIDARIRLGDAGAVYDAIVHAVEQLQRVADELGDVIGDPESLARVRAMRERHRKRGHR